MRGPRDQKSLEISNHFSLGCLRGCSAKRIDPGRGIKSFRIYRFSVSVHGDFYGPLSRRADSPREIDEAERPGRMRGPRDQKSPEISSHVSLFACLRGSSVARGTCRPGAEIQNLSKSTIYKLVVFSFCVRFYILITHRISRYGFSQTIFLRCCKQRVNSSLSYTKVFVSHMFLLLSKLLVFCIISVLYNIRKSLRTLILLLIRCC